MAVTPPVHTHGMATYNDSTPSGRTAPPTSIIIEIIARYGFVVNGIGYGECREPGCRCTSPSSTPWTYTTGLTSLGQPELVMLGPTSHAAHHVVNAVVAARREGRLTLEPTDTTADGINVRIVDVPERWVRADRSRMSAWFAYYGSDRLPVVQQVLWPDPLGRFPDDPAFQQSLRTRQPVLRDHPMSYPLLQSRGPGRRRR